MKGEVTFGEVWRFPEVQPAWFDGWMSDGHGAAFLSAISRGNSCCSVGEWVAKRWESFLETV